jgi:diguanylate cyclase (GGDEF)-like protein
LSEEKTSDTIHNPRKMMTRIYVISLSIIALLAIAAHMLLNSVIEQQLQTGKIINVSGQQRMLSQRATLFTLDYLETGSSAAKNTAQKAINQMVQNHDELLMDHFKALSNNQPSPLSNDMINLYFNTDNNVDTQLARFVSLISDTLASPPRNENIFSSEGLAFKEMAKEPLLTALHNVVSLYEKESLDEVDKLRSAQQVVLVITIFTILIEAVFVFRPMVSKISAFARHLQWEATHDYLSGIFNRRAFFMIGEKLLNNNKRNKKPTSIIMIDIDKFKIINDEYGHAVGDTAIQHVARITKKNIRSSDVLARFGGEEFVILLSETNTDGAVTLAEKIRKKINETALSVKEQNIIISASFGVSASVLSDDALELLIQKADDRLYVAKESGRNKVEA